MVWGVVITWAEMPPGTGRAGLSEKAAAIWALRADERRLTADEERERAMGPREIFRMKEALKVLEYAGAQGVARDALLGQTEIATGQILTSAEKARLLEVLESKQWAYSYRDPLTDTVRWVISGPGTLARATL